MHFQFTNLYFESHDKLMLVFFHQLTGSLSSFFHYCLGMISWWVSLSEQGNEILIRWVAKQSKISRVNWNEPVSVIANQYIFRFYVPMKQSLVLMQISYVTHRHNEQFLNIKFIIDLAHYIINLHQAKIIRNLRRPLINHNQFLVSHWFIIEEV